MATGFRLGPGGSRGVCRVGWSGLWRRRWRQGRGCGVGRLRVLVGSWLESPGDSVDGCDGVGVVVGAGWRMPLAGVGIAVGACALAVSAGWPGSAFVVAWAGFVALPCAVVVLGCL